MGNVLVTVSDRRVGISKDGILVDHYEPAISSSQEYYPFGMLMPGRQSGGGYRYGFNGQEKSHEIKGAGNSYTAAFWEYDPRIGRRWNIDPVKKEWESSYACFSNNPIDRTDVNGDKDTTVTTADNKGVVIGDDIKASFFAKDIKYRLSNPNGKNDGAELNITPGTAKSFTVGGKEFVAKFNPEALTFSGYYDKDNNKLAFEAEQSLSNDFSLKLIRADTHAHLFGSLIGKSPVPKWLIQKIPFGPYSRNIIIGNEYSSVASYASRITGLNKLVSADLGAAHFGTKFGRALPAYLGQAAVALQVAENTYINYRIVTTNPSFEEVQETYNHWWNPMFFLYKKIEPSLQKLGER
ncbi:hypothetical protein [Chitinophaga silvisoli]|uniref:RHS repeat-associated core domain-containing protein n=1 Tax=Chitinophaga silvisoli TaxID=2291814 RepID=A0A3E1NWN8_9BACT|nr:hypothetical protein [Chitinophaga silvisoli]RFM32346.1 hypothetical protein DXN04_21910 [Chitinophaga silvisoli]